MTIYVDGSGAGPRAGWAYCAGGQSAAGTVPTRSVFAAELTAVIQGLRAVGAGPITVVCDNADVVAGIDGRRHPLSYDHVDVGPLWAEYDRAAAGRTITARFPTAADRSPHRECDRLSRAASRVLHAV